MNEQLQAELLKIVTNINNGVESAWGFLTDQTPDVIYQLLLWHGVKSFLWFFVLFAVGVALFIITPKMYRKSNALADKARQDYKNKEPWTLFNGGSNLINGGINLTSNEYDSVFFFFNLLKGAPVLGGLFLTFAFCDITWLQIWIAPKVWLLEYITAMVK